VEEGKLKEKKQNDQQLKQAFHAVSLYYELGLNLKIEIRIYQQKKEGKFCPPFF